MIGVTGITDSLSIVKTIFENMEKHPVKVTIGLALIPFITGLTVWIRRKLRKRKDDKKPSKTKTIEEEQEETYDLRIEVLEKDKALKEEARRISRFIDTGIESGYSELISKNRIASYIADSKSWQLGSEDACFFFDVSSFFGMGKRSISLIVSDVQNALDEILKNTGPIDKFIGFPCMSGDPFLNICYEDGRVEDSKVIGTLEELSSLEENLHKGCRLFILSAYFKSDNIFILKSCIEKIKELYSDDPCRIVGGFVLFTDNSLSEDNLQSLLETENLYQPFRLNLGHR